MPQQAWSDLLAQAEGLLNGCRTLSRAAPAGSISSLISATESNLQRITEQLAILRGASASDSRPTDDIASDLDGIDFTLANLMRSTPSAWEQALNELSNSTSELTAVLESVIDSTSAHEHLSEAFQPSLLHGFETDAKRQNTAMWAYLATTILLAGAVVYVLFKALGDLPDSAVGVVLVLVGLAALVMLALAALRESGRCRRSSLESLRLRRQLEVLEPYLRPLPMDTRNLMRAVLTPRLFPRLIEDDNPLREEEKFPTPDNLLVSISASYRNFRQAKTQR